jgi:pimeloyl-ACP methyl ester carboxylesterase
MESWASDPETDDRASAIQNRRVVKVANAGHWVHHDQLDVFLDETGRFLLETD